MVSNVTSLTGNGLKDWLIQRVTAIMLAVYVLVLFGYVVSHPGISYTQWAALFHLLPFEIATVLVLFALILHAWIGIWTVTTDYIKCTILRLSVQMVIAIGLLGQFVWGLIIVWGH